MSNDVTATLTETIRNRYHAVLEKISTAAHVVGRNADDIKLVVVTKGQSLEVTQAAIGAGVKYIGENYVQEALAKMGALSDAQVEWHMIGHVQSRKAREVVENFAWLHSLDRLKLARRCNQFAAQAGIRIPVLLECNVSKEASKFGWSAWDEMRWPEFAEQISALFEFDHLEIQGLMTMPPFDPDPENVRPYFEKLRRLRDYLVNEFPDTNWQELSMGMSNDFEVAIQEGATIIRVGTAIVGARS